MFVDRLTVDLFNRCCAQLRETDQVSLLGQALVVKTRLHAEDQRRIHLPVAMVNEEIIQPAEATDFVRTAGQIIYRLGLEEAAFRARSLEVNQQDRVAAEEQAETISAVNKFCKTVRFGRLTNNDAQVTVLVFRECIREFVPQAGMFVFFNGRSRSDPVGRPCSDHFRSNYLDLLFQTAHTLLIACSLFSFLQAWKRISSSSESSRMSVLD